MDIRKLKYIDSRAQSTKDSIRQNYKLKLYRFIILMIVASVFTYMDTHYINQSERCIMFQILFCLVFDFTFCICAGIPLSEYSRIQDLVSWEYIKMFFSLLLTWFIYYIVLVCICSLFGADEFVKDRSWGIEKILTGEGSYNDLNIVLVGIAVILTLMHFISKYYQQESEVLDDVYKQYRMSEEGMRLLKKVTKLPLNTVKMEGGEIAKWILKRK